MTASAMHAQLPRPVYWNDLRTKSTHAWLMCPKCGGTVRVMPLGFACVRGCGWEYWRRDTAAR